MVRLDLTEGMSLRRYELAKVRNDLIDGTSLPRYEFAKVRDYLLSSVHAMPARVQGVRKLTIHEWHDKALNN